MKDLEDTSDKSKRVCFHFIDVRVSNNRVYPKFVMVILFIYFWFTFGGLVGPIISFMRKNQLIIVVNSIILSLNEKICVSVPASLLLDIPISCLAYFFVVYILYKLLECA